MDVRLASATRCGFMPSDDPFAALRRSPFRQRIRLGARERAYLEAKGIDTVLAHAGLRRPTARAREPRND